MPSISMSPQAYKPGSGIPPLAPAEVEAQQPEASTPGGYFPQPEPEQGGLEGFAGVEPPRRPMQPNHSPKLVRPAMRSEHGVLPETWGEYSLWVATKRMDQRYRSIRRALSLVEDPGSHRDSFDDALHFAIGSCSSIYEVIANALPGGLLAEANKASLAKLIGKAVFSLSSLHSLLSENWGYGKPISGTHFAGTEDLAGVAGIYQKAASTVGTPTEVVDIWHGIAKQTAAGLLAIVGKLSQTFWGVTWGGTEGFDVEAAATVSGDTLECLEILATLLGLTLYECLAENLHEVNKVLPEGWKTPE